MTERKTGRRYGAIYRVIRRMAAAGKPFTITSLPLPREQARNNCNVMYRSGELVRVSPGTVGRKAKPAVYRIRTAPTAP